MAFRKKNPKKYKSQYKSSSKKSTYSACSKSYRYLRCQKYLKIPIIIKILKIAIFRTENHEKDREVPEHIDKIRPRKFLGIRMNQVDLPIPHLLFYDFNQTQTCLIRMTIYQKIKTL